MPSTPEATIHDMVEAKGPTVNVGESGNLFRPAVLIPNHNHQDAISELLDRLEVFQIPCLMVDDGSSSDVANYLEKQADTRDWVDLIRRPEQGGKGACVVTGLKHLEAGGFTHAIQIDADGQHDVGDLGKFLETSQDCPRGLILGTPEFGPDVPTVRLAGRQISRVLIWLETFSFDIHDPLFGYRVYPLKSTMSVVRSCWLGQRMDFDPEIAVRLKWLGVPVKTIRTRVHYPDGGLSNFRMAADNALMVWLHVRLVFALVGRLIPHFSKEPS